MSIPTHPQFLRPALLAAFLVGGSGGFAAEWQSLTGNSPFGQTAASGPAAAPDDLEFRGVVQEEGVYLVNLFNPATKTSQWIPVQGQAPGLVVGSYDAHTDKLQVTQAGRPLTLALKQARVTLAQPVAAPAAPNPGETNQGDRPADGRGGRPGSGGDPAAMIRNLPPEAQAMIQEFRRRRAERATSQQSAPARPRQQ